MFSTYKSKIDKLFVRGETDSLKSKLGYINSVLSEFCIKVATVRKQEKKGNKTSFYKLEHLHNISEIVEHKIKRGFTLRDASNIYQSPTQHRYSHLILKTFKEPIINNNMNIECVDEGVDDNVESVVDEPEIEIKHTNNEIEINVNNTNDKSQIEHTIISSIDDAPVDAEKEYLKTVSPSCSLFDN